MQIVSPMATGNGAYIVHEALATHIPGYRLIGYDPRRTLFPPLLLPLGRPRRGESPADILHTTPDYAWFHTGIAKRTVITFHNYVLDAAMRTHSSRLQWLHYRSDLRLFTHRAMAMTDLVSCVSQSTRELIRDYTGYTGEMRVITNGVDCSRFSPAESGADNPRFTLLFSGNPSQRKGFDSLVPLARRLGESVCIRYTGGLNNGGPSDARSTILEPLGRIEYCAMPEVYRAANALLVTSFREGHSLAVLEAMASGLPVIGFRISSLPEQVVEGRGGLLVEYGDLDALVGAVRHLRDDRELCRAMGSFNRERALTHFTLERMLGGYRALFDELSN